MSSYLGRGIDQIDNISTLDNLSFNGSSTTFNLTQNSVAFTPVSADALQIQIDGIVQSGNYTVANATVSFDFTPASGSVCNSVKHFGVGLLSQPSDGSVNMAQLGASGTKSSSTFLRGDNTFATPTDTNTVYTHPNHSGEVTSTADGATVITDNIVDEANLKVSNSPVNGYMLTSQSGASGGMTWASAPSSTLVKIATVNQVGDASFVELQNCFNSTYQSYLVVIRRFTPSTSGEGLRMRLMTSTNTPVNSSNYRYASRYFNHDGGSASNTGTGQSSWVIANPVGSAEANGGASSSMWFNVGTNNNSDSSGRFNGTISFSDGNGKQLTGYIGGYYNTSYGSTASTGLEWFATNGNVARLQATCYGVIL